MFRLTQSSTKTKAASSQATPATVLETSSSSSSTAPHSPKTLLNPAAVKPAKSTVIMPNDDRSVKRAYSALTHQYHETGGGGETNFSNEEIENVCTNIVEEGSSTAAATNSRIGMYTDEKNIYYNDMKAAAATNSERGFYNIDRTFNRQNDDHEVSDDEEEDEEEEEEEEDDDDETVQVSRLVEVKYNCDYDYDNQKFHLAEGETLILINKSNQDWWLCLRLSERLTFFVPASYVKEIVSSSHRSSLARRLKPPPRPPPPPPPPPQVKKRTWQQPTPNRTLESSSATQSVYENLADSGSGIGGSSAKIDQINYDEYGLNPDAIISDLDDRLNREEESFVAREKEMSGTAAATASISNVPGSSRVVLPSASIDTDYDEQHIYQNFPFVERKKIQPVTTNRDSIDERKSAPARIDEGQNQAATSAKAKLIRAVNNLKLDEEPSKSIDEDDEDEDDDEEEEDEDEEDEEEEEESSSRRVGGDSSEDHELNSEETAEIGKVAATIYVPKGWKVEATKYKNRKCFVNELNGDKWYLNYDQNGNHYFYNANNESAWQLPDIYTQEDNRNEENLTGSSGGNFFKIIDQDLPTFKNLYSRLATTTAKQDTSAHMKSCAPNVETSGSSKQAGFSSTTSSSSSSAATSNGLGSSGGGGSGGNASRNTAVTTVNNASAAATFMTPPPTTTISYSNKPPSDLNSNFKCILLAKSGKKCRKKNSDNYKVSLVSTKLLFVKDSKTPKLEFFVDFKGGKCYKVDTQLVKKSSLVVDSTVDAKTAKEREKERAELAELVGSKSSALVVETLTGYRILLINENDTIVNDWIYAINSIITQIQSEFSPIYEGPELLHATQIHDVVDNTKPSSKLAMSQPNSSDTNNNKKQPKTKECVFGSNLINLCKKEKRNVPFFVDEIINSIENKGLDMDGIYRISGNLSEVQKVRYQVDHGKYNFKDFDIHVLCGALKTFFRELEDPLIPYNFHQHFINSTTIQDRTTRFKCVQDLIKKLPLAHRETLRNLLRHLLKVIDLASQNRMNLQNIALVFGPNIMRGNPLNEASTGFNPHIMTQNAIVEYLLMNYRELYSFQSNSIFTEYSD